MQRDELVGTLQAQVDIARRLGAVDVTIVATEPLRRAADAHRVVQEIRRGHGVPVHVLEHDEEGILTLLGVTGGVPVEDDVVVVDIGGGSPGDRRRRTAPARGRPRHPGRSRAPRGRPGRA